MVVDLRSQVIIKMWKGYRISNMGFVVLKDRLYLAAFSTNRLMIHMWDMEGETKADGFGLEKEDRVALGVEMVIVKRGGWIERLDEKMGPARLELATSRL